MVKGGIINKICLEVSMTKQESLSINKEQYQKTEAEAQKDDVQKEESTQSFDGLERQIQAEYDVAWKHQKPKKDQNALRLKLYNNQKRDLDAVGDTTMFTIHQTVLASLYDDRLTTDFVGREEGDDEVAENLTKMAEADYVDMEKDKIDYDWDWDTTFFGRGILGLEEYIREPDKGIYLPLPEVIDPMVFLHDPNAVSINGDRKHRGGCGFFGLEVSLTEKDINDLPDKRDDIVFTELSHTGGINSLYRDASEARNNAQNRQTQKNEQQANLGANAGYIVTRWYTHFLIGGEVKKVKAWLGNDRSKLLAVTVLKNQDYWQFIDRPLYPTSHDWDGTSIPDLTEDKQRARAITQNLALKAMEADLYQSYIYDSVKINNRADLTRIANNKFIPVDKLDNGNINNVIAPINKARPNMELLSFIYNSLDASAQQATATPDIQQGMQSAKDRPLGETNLIASRVDTRYSLSAKVFGWSERSFWQQWYRLYKDNFVDHIDEKILRIEGIFGAKWRPLTRENIIAPKVDPDIKIESKAVNRAKQLEDRQGLQQYLGMAFQEQNTNRRYGLRMMGKLFGMSKAELDRLYPPTIDEREAGQENDLLNNNKLAPVTREQNHEVHLLEHMKAADTPASRTHVKAHQQALLMKRSKPELFPEDPADVPFGPQDPQSGGTTSRPIAPSQASS